jgi:branched-chain amino acid transport system permease protein
MEDFLASILVGLLGGAPYALLGLGVVLVYKGSKVFNFAQGEFGTVAAFTAYLLQFRMSLWIASLIGIAVGILMGLLTERLVVQPLFNAPKVTLLVATSAVTSASIALQLAIGDATFRSYPSLVEGTAFQVFNVPVRWQQLLVLAALGFVAFALFVFFRTELGTAVLAASPPTWSASAPGACRPWCGGWPGWSGASPACWWPPCSRSRPAT